MITAGFSGNRVARSRCAKRSAARSTSRIAAVVGAAQRRYHCSCLCTNFDMHIRCMRSQAGSDHVL